MIGSDENQEKRENKLENCFLSYCLRLRHYQWQDQVQRFFRGTGMSFDEVSTMLTDTGAQTGVFEESDQSEYELIFIFHLKAGDLSQSELADLDEIAHVFAKNDGNTDCTRLQNIVSADTANRYETATDHCDICGAVKDRKDRKSTRLNSSHSSVSRMPSSA